MKSIVLVGYMGCGKSSLGCKLSYRFKMSLIDTDKEIERKNGMRISQIFASKGEEAFRDMETGYLKELAESKHPHIISTGGGLPLREENRELLKKCGTVIYLRTKPETVYERIKGDTTRPLLQCDNPQQKIIDMLKERESKYEACADLVIDTDEHDLVSLVGIVEKALKGRKNMKKKKLLVINGPNLNFLGIREKAVYGNQDYNYLKNMIANKAKSENISIEVFQSNHEGAIIDRIQEAYFDGTEGIVINPGAFTHYSYAIHDALQSIETMPKVEIHISDITKREDFRKVSVTKAACDHQIYGHGLQGYIEAIDYILRMS